MKTHVKKNDLVVVISGKYKDSSEDLKEGKIAKRKVVAVYPQKGRVALEGLVIRKAVRKSQDRPQGGFVERSATIHISNVMLAEAYNQRRGKGKLKKN